LRLPFGAALVLLLAQANAANIIGEGLMRSGKQGFVGLSAKEMEMQLFSDEAIAARVDLGMESVFAQYRRQV